MEYLVADGPGFKYKIAISTSNGITDANKIIGTNQFGFIDSSLINGNIGTGNYNIDGGSANSIYTASQSINGGGANG